MRKLIFTVPVLLALAACVPYLTEEEAVAATATQQAYLVSQGCAYLEAAGTPYPCAPPTATPTPQPTPTPTPTFTPTPFTGWKRVTELGETPMPPGFEPDCEGIVGCPDKLYRYYINDVPVPAEQGGVTGTPGYWPYVLVGGPIAVVFIAIMVYGVYTATAPNRALAKGVKAMMEAQAAVLRQLPAPNQNPQAVPIEVLAQWLVKFVRQNQVPPQFVPEMRQQLSVYQPGQSVPLPTIVDLLRGFDKKHQTDVAGQFGQFVEVTVRSNQLAKAR